MKKRIAFISANLDTLYENEIICAMSDQAAILGYDLLLLSHFVNYENGSDSIRGDENIYTLIEQLPFDGAVLESGSYYSKKLVSRIEELLRKKGVPVVVYDQPSSIFHSCMQNDREGFRQVTEHFIKVHGHRKIYCLSGPEDNPHSEQRISGYKDALRANGIAVRKKYIFYGDFWIDSPVKLAERILSGELERPQSIVCGNDYMALQLSHSLISGGISVPDDIAVGGFDGNPDAYKFQPTVTTFCGEYVENAAASVRMLHEIISGESGCQRTDVHTGIRTGASCGCKTGLTAEYCSRNFILDESMRSIYLHSSYSSIMNNVKSIRECALVMAQNMYLLSGNSDFFMCFNSDALSDSSEPDVYRKTGYSERMSCVLSYCGGVSDINELSFDIENIIPEKYHSDECMTYVCTPLHYLDRCFGYCVRRYEKGKLWFEQYYGEFCQVAANSAEKIRMLNYENSLNERIQKLSERDILTGLYSRTGLEKWSERQRDNSRYFAVLYYLSGLEQDDEKDAQKKIVSFAQAVNLSCTGGEIAARIGADEFLIAGECDGSDHPEQFLINTLKSNLRVIEKQQGIDLVGTVTHFVAEGTDRTEISLQLSDKLESYKCSGSEKNAVFLSMIRQLHYSIYEEPQHDWNSGDEAEKIGISQSYFQHLYRQYLNVSFNADVIGARMTLAERLLLNTSLNVSEIAERCGYPDASHFMKLFRRKNGQTALSYRKNNRK